MNDINVTKITCPICNEEKCYEDTHIDENGQFIVKEWLCYGCGYTSTSDYTVNDDKTYEELMPKSVVALKKVDTERNLNWYPCVLTTTKGYIFPELSAVDWHWFSAPIIELTKSNIDKIPIDSKAEIGDYVIALWLGNKYDKTDFESACGNLGLTVKRHLDLEE